MEMTYCNSCAAPLSNPNFKGVSDDYCVYCSDETGKLKSRQDIEQAIVGWFSQWQKNVDDETLLQRAKNYMSAMPEWA